MVLVCLDSGEARHKLMKWVGGEAVFIYSFSKCLRNHCVLGVMMGIDQQAKAGTVSGFTELTIWL